MNERVTQGGCLCGAVRWRATGAPANPTLCHCVSCRRAAGAPAVAWVTFERAAFSLLGEPPTRFRSSPPVERSFCPRCGTPLTYQHTAFPLEIDVSVGSMDEPERAAPSDHTWWEERLTWLRCADGLPTFARSRREGGRER